MSCIKMLFCLCQKKKKSIKLTKLKLLNCNLDNNITIKKRSNSFPMHPSCDFIFKNYQYENDEIKLFANRAIKHHNNTKHGK